jgi:hypothetical protein
LACVCAAAAPAAAVTLKVIFCERGMQRGIIYTSSYSVAAATAAGRLLAKRQHINNQTCILLAAAPRVMIQINTCAQQLMFFSFHAFLFDKSGVKFALGE